MKELCVAGRSDFVVGFQLAGVRRAEIIEKDYRNKIEGLLGDKNIGILVLEEEQVRTLPEHMQHDITKSVSPVVVVLSKEGGASHLRQDIIRAIGVDLWKDS